MGRVHAEEGTMFRNGFCALTQGCCFVGFIATVALLLPCVPAAIGGGYRELYGAELPPLVGWPVMVAVIGAAGLGALYLFEWVGTAMAADPQTGRLRVVRRTLWRGLVCAIVVVGFFAVLGLTSPVRSMAVRCLWLGGRYSLPLLERALDDAAAQVRLAALASLADLKQQARPLLPQVRQALQDPDEQVRWKAEELVEKLH
jgi:hypothetical protein